MLISVTFSKPTSSVLQNLGKPYKRIKIKTGSSSSGASFYAEFFTDTQVFHKTFSKEELDSFIEQNAGINFKSCIKKFSDKEVTLLANKKGKITVLEKKLSPAKMNYLPALSSQDSLLKNNLTHNRIKNYIIPEGTPVPFLIRLGVMTPEGKIVNSKYDKFKQINRFLEYINDILPSVLEQKKCEDYPLQIADFGCGKSYLTFAVHYYLTQIKKIDCKIIGLDLKEDVIEYCNSLAKEFDCSGLIFKTGDISKYSDSEKEHNPDIVITLHACDTATDYALKYAVLKNAKAILSVPCCQHEINMQLEQNKRELENTDAEIFKPLLKYGLIRERVSALITDSLRAEYLESAGYKVDVMEFIDMSHTPKNILLRAVRKNQKKDAGDKTDVNQNKPVLIDTLKIAPSIWK
ncbi:MAG: SAM-dependent methyltransferase [Spirochaetia bacterium]|nr:SAM-dependent methyltransferase [Spirochaetia bacterium]MDD7699680.1 SAM-dependent methyltransferase [Spirochaetia bacterium]